MSLRFWSTKNFFLFNSLITKFLFLLVLLINKKESRYAKRRERGLSREKKKGKSKGKGGFYGRDGVERQKRETLGKEFLEEEWGRLEVC